MDLLGLQNSIFVSGTIDDSMFEIHSYFETYMLTVQCGSILQECNILGNEISFGVELFEKVRHLQGPLSSSLNGGRLFHLLGQRVLVGAHRQLVRAAQ